MDINVYNFMHYVVHINLYVTMHQIVCINTRTIN
jgi:hypothetical protein